MAAESNYRHTGAVQSPVAERATSRMPVPQGRVHTTLTSYDHDTRTTVRVCRVELMPRSALASSVAASSSSSSSSSAASTGAAGASLPYELIRSPGELTFRVNVIKKRNETEWKRFKSENPNLEASFHVMPDSSQPALGQWNAHVREAHERGLYWIISLPVNASMSSSGAIPPRYLIVDAQLNEEGMHTVPASLSAGREPVRVPAHAMPVRLVRAWIVTGQELERIRPQVKSVQAAAPAAQVLPLPSNPVVHMSTSQTTAPTTGVNTYRALGTLSQTHEEWPFGAMAELIDNALDADAKLLSINLERGETPASATLRLLDDGVGMTMQTMKRMLCEVGWSSKNPDVHITSRSAAAAAAAGLPAAAATAKSQRVSSGGAPSSVFVGRYGLGLKTGVFRLGAAVHVLTKYAGMQPLAAVVGNPARDAADSPVSFSSSAVPSRVRVPISSASALQLTGVKPLDSPWSIGFLSLPDSGSSGNQFSGAAWNQVVQAHVLGVNPNKGFNMDPADATAKAACSAILNGTFPDLAAVLEAFKTIPGESGTLIVISRLRRYGDNLELQVEQIPLAAASSSSSSSCASSSPPRVLDIRLPQLKPGQHFLPGRDWAAGCIDMDWSLRAYARVLYRKPRMKIMIQGSPIISSCVEATLRQVNVPGHGVCSDLDTARQYQLFIGHSDLNMHNKMKGVMLYHGNRLISSYQLHTYLDEPYMGVLSTDGIPGVDVMNNKQRYVSSKAYHDLTAWITAQCNVFRVQVAKLQADLKGRSLLLAFDDWIQCDRCHLWRKYPLSESSNIKSKFPPGTKWFCSNNTWDSQYAVCNGEEEAYSNRDEVDIVPLTQEEVEAHEENEREIRRQRANIRPAPIATQEPRNYDDFKPQVTSLNECGRGTTATVYRVESEEDNCVLALKKFEGNLGHALHQEMAGIFERELANQRMVQHPNVMRVVGWIRDQYLCLLMEHVAGRNLDELMNGNAHHARTHLSHITKHRILLGITDGMRAMHQEHIVHRDLKPANIMVEISQAVAAVSSVTSEDSDDRIYTPKITDFGLALQVKQANRTNTSRVSMALKDLLPSLPEPSPTAEPRVLESFPLSANALDVTEMDASDWAGAGFSTYDRWCTRTVRNYPGNIDVGDDLLASYWGWKCMQNACCRAKRPTELPQGSGKLQEDEWVLYYIFGLGFKSTSGDVSPNLLFVPESNFFRGWCSIASQQRRSAIQNFWETLLVSSSLITRTELELQLYGTWRLRYLSKRTTMRTLLSIKNSGCMLPGCPPKVNEDGFTAKMLLHPFESCNITTLPLLQLPKLSMYAMGNSMPDFGREPTASLNASRAVDRFFELATYGFILDWRVNASDVHSKYYDQCAARVCTYQTFATAHVVTLIGVLLGVLAGAKDLLEAGLNFLVPKLCASSQAAAHAHEGTKQIDSADECNGATRQDCEEGGDVLVSHGSSSAAGANPSHVRIYAPSGSSPPAEGSRAGVSDSEQDEEAPLVRRK